MLTNSFYMLASVIVRLMTQVLLFVVLARAWGVELFGAFVYPFTVSMLVVMVVDYGFSLQLLRDVGRDTERVNAIVRDAFCVKIGLAVVILLVVGLATPYLPTDHNFRGLLWLLLVAAIFGSFGLLFNLPFRGLGCFQEETKVVLGANLFHFVLVGTLAWLGCGAVAVAVGFVVSRFLYLALSWFCYSRVAGKLEFSSMSPASLLRGMAVGFPFAVHVALAGLYFQVDTLIVYRFLGAEGVGVYQAGLRIVIAGLALADVLGNVYIPRLAQVCGYTESLIQTGTRMTRHLLIPGALGFTLLIVFAKWLATFAYGPGYESVAPLLPLMGVVFFLRYFGTSYGALLTVADRQVVRAVGVGLAVVVNVVLNFLLIPRFGLKGAVLSSIITHLFLDGVYVTFAWFQVQSLLLGWRGVFMLVAVLVVNSTVLLASDTALGMRLVFCALMVLTLSFVGLTKQEWMRLSHKSVRL